MNPHISTISLHIGLLKLVKSLQLEKLTLLIVLVVIKDSIKHNRSVKKMQFNFDRIYRLCSFGIYINFSFVYRLHIIFNLLQIQLKYLLQSDNLINPDIHILCRRLYKLLYSLLLFYTAIQTRAYVLSYFIILLFLNIHLPCTLFHFHLENTFLQFFQRM